MTVIANFPLLVRGSIYMDPSEVELLAHTVMQAEGDHCEIGSMWGGSAVTACLAMQAADRTGRVVCIDPFVEAGFDGKPTAEIFWQNIEAAGFAVRVELHVCESAPWPLPTSRRFGTVLIDGNHKAPWPETDWESAQCVTDVILLHDVNFHEPAVAKLNARLSTDPGWRVRDYARFLYVYERTA